MARPGDILEHPVTGEKMIVLKTAAETNGELFKVDLSVRPHGFIAAAHVHPRQVEHFQILSGTLTARIDGQEHRYRAGDELSVPAGQPHVWWNDGDDELRVLVEVRPALRTEQFFENFFGLGRDGKTNPRTGLPGLLQLAVIANHFDDEVYLSQPPHWLQRILFGVLSRVGRLRGYRAVYPRYSRDSVPAEDDNRLAA